MTTKEINAFRTRTVKAIEAGRLNDAISAIRELPPSVRDYPINSALDAAAEHYGYMLRYFAEGASDPGRRDSYDDLRADLRAVVDRCTRRMMSDSTSTLYYNTVRTLGIHPGRSLGDAVAQWRELQSKIAGTFDIGDAAGELRRLAAGCENELFERVWTQFPMTGDDKRSAAALLDSDSPASHSLRMRLIAAVGLGLMEFYDVRRFGLLAEVLDSASDESESLAATAWLLLALFRYRKRRHAREVRSRLKAAAEHPLWQRRVRAVYLELLRARDTERVTRQVRDEFMPDIMRLGKDILDKGGLTVDDSDGEIELNPDWEDKMRSSGLYDRMREFSEMTAGGADIFMGAFSHLKNYPFFNSLPAWFTPFDESNAEVAAALAGEMSTFVDMLARMPMPCDNDKFSILFSLEATPADKRAMMASQIEANREAMEQSGMLDSRDSSSGAAFARAYVQNLYRFFKLYGRRQEFFDPFARGIFLQDIDLLESAVRNADTLGEAASLLFDINAWDDARRCYELLGSVAEPSAEIYQKTAYCLEQTGRLKEAADTYAYADLMESDNAWTLRRMARTLSMSDRPEKAVEVYERILRLQPENAEAKRLMAYELIKSGDYTGASSILRRLVSEVGAEPDANLRRALAWSTFLSGDADTARSCYREILSHGATATDYLNMGHLAWAEGRMADAIKLYGKCMDARGYDAAALERDIRDDLPALSAYRLNVSDLPLILDAIRMGV